MEKLNLSCNAIGSEGAKLLKKCQHKVMRFELEGCGIPQDDISFFENAPSRKTRSGNPKGCCFA